MQWVALKIVTEILMQILKFISHNDIKKEFHISPLPKPAEATVETGRKLPVLKVNSLIIVRMGKYFVMWTVINPGKIINSY